MKRSFTTNPLWFIYCFKFAVGIYKRDHPRQTPFCSSSSSRLALLGQNLLYSATLYRFSRRRKWEIWVNRSSDVTYLLYFFPTTACSMFPAISGTAGNLPLHAALVYVWSRYRYRRGHFDTGSRPGGLPLFNIETNDRLFCCKSSNLI